MAAPRVSARAGSVAPFEVMDVVRAARERDERVASGDALAPTCHLEVGQPSHPAPRVVRDAARSSLEGPLGYSDALGTPELREAISQWYGRRHDVDVPAERIAVTTGASAGCVLAFCALADPGDTVVASEPGYPCYGAVLRTLGIAVRTVTVDRSTHYRLTGDHLDAAVAGPGDGTRVAAVVVASPSNPTGTVLHEDDLAGLHRWCDRHGVTLVVDEIYHGTSPHRLPTAAAWDDTVVVQSFSKYFCMTGWRLGWLVLPPDLVRPVERLAQNLYLCPPVLAQRAAPAAFDATEELDAHAAVYEANRRTLTEALRAAGVGDIAPAEGAFYVWADMSAWGSSGELSRRWLEEIGVACTPGADFDGVRGGDFVRFSVAGSAGEVAEASSRLGAWLRAHRREPATRSATGDGATGDGATGGGAS